MSLCVIDIFTSGKGETSGYEISPNVDIFFFSFFFSGDNGAVGSYEFVRFSLSNGVCISSGIYVKFMSGNTSPFPDE